MKSSLAVGGSPGRLRRDGLLALFWSAGRGRAVGFATLVVAAGVLPTVAILATGALVAAVPGVARGGLDGAERRAALLALAGVAASLALVASAGNALRWAARVLDAEVALEVHDRVARAALAPPGVAPLEDPVFAGEVKAVQEAERIGVLQRTATELSNVATQRLRGAGAFAVLLGFGWWAPFPLAAAWYLTNLVYRKATQAGAGAAVDDHDAGLRRAEYLRSFASDPPAARELRVFGLGGWVLGRYAGQWQQAAEAMWRERRANRGLTAAAVLALLAAHAAVLGALAAAAYRGQVGVAALTVFIQAVIATSDLGVAGDSEWWLAQARDVARRVARLGELSGAPLPEPPRARVEPGDGRIAVRLDDVRFTYRGRDTPVLDGFTLQVPAGQSLAIVGENGAGKSTLIKLLCGLYQPDGGRITLGGGDSPLQARGRVGVIFQDFVRYRLPLRENVGFGHLPLLHDGDELERALRDAGGEALAAALPKGWDTVLSRDTAGGADLSGGQWQRVALARALAAVRGGAGLLILDEPASALDVRAETELFERFLELTRGVTTILVSHRLSSVRHADRIVVVEGGRVVEDGTHDELMRAGRRYARMFSLQAERFAAPSPASGAPAAEVGDA